VHTAIVALTLASLLSAPARGGNARACMAPSELAERYRNAVLRADAEFIISLFADVGLTCMDSRVPKKAVAVDLETVGSFIRSVVFDGDRLRKIRAREHWDGEESLREYFGRSGLRVRIDSTEPAIREASQSVCIRYEVEGDERPDAQLCAHCVKGSWVVFEWEYECRVSAAALRQAKKR
jgi:hypothetical protein